MRGISALFICLCNVVEASYFICYVCMNVYLASWMHFLTYHKLQILSLILLSLLTLISWFEEDIDSPNEAKHYMTTLAARALVDGLNKIMFIFTVKKIKH